jgi:hypothetical protein
MAGASDLPEGAVEAIKANLDRWSDGANRAYNSKRAEVLAKAVVLAKAAAPYIRKQERERVEKAFFGALKAAGWSEREAIPAYEFDTLFDRAFRTLEDSDPDGVQITQTDTRGGWDERRSSYSQKDYEIDRQNRGDSDG